MNIISSDQFINMLDEGIIEDNQHNINFNDEIVSIKSVGIRDTMDINVKGKDHFFFANDILTHNSATGNNLDFKSVDNSSVSDSIGTVQTADFILFLLQTEEMKEQKIITCKCTKNRFTGMTDHWDMNVDYTHMRFSDAIVENSDLGMTEKEITQEISSIKQQDMEIIQRKDTTIKEDVDVMAVLGL